VLGQLADVPGERRGAHFACTAALALPAGREHVTEGTMRGRIIYEPRGENGFGYDPVFVPDGGELTSAELSPADKDRISHRGKALRALAPVIAATVS
jgi:XTP/dITP diphosphohydrolase